MTPPAVVGALLDAFTDLGRVLEGMSEEEALANDAGSTYAWTVGHLANQVDSWINVRFAHRAPNPLVSADRYRFGGDGRAESWSELRDAAVEVRAAATDFLTSMTEADLQRAIPYPGSLPELKDRQVTLRYTLIRVLTHHYFHIGELASKRSAAGHSVGDYPGPLLRTAEADR